MHLLRNLAVFFILFLSTEAYAQHMQEKRIADSDEKGCFPVMPYHGMRMMMSGDRFYVREIETDQAKNGTLRIDIRFNVPIDPRTVTLPYIQINESPLPQEVRVVFNKAGTVMRLKIPAAYYAVIKQHSPTSFRLDLLQAASFNGIPLSKKTFDPVKKGISCDSDDVCSEEQN